MVEADAKMVQEIVDIASIHTCEQLGIEYPTVRTRPISQDGGAGT